MIVPATRESEGYQRIKSTALSYVDSMRVGEVPGAYAKERAEKDKSQFSLYGSYHAAHILDLFRELQELPPRDIDAWATHFQTRQTRWGYFAADPSRETRERSIAEMEARWHYSRGNIWALRILNRRPEHPFRFAEPLLDRGRLYDWVKSYDWSNPWAAGNQICAGATVLLAMRDWFGASDVDEAMEREMYPALEELIDPDTGYWGTQLGADLARGNFGTIHLTPIYFVQDWPLSFVERNVDSTLAIQLEDGSFWPGGSDCPDFDGAYMLYNLHCLTDYRRDDVEAAARRYLAHALMHEDPGGRGFLLHRRDSTPADWKPRPHWIWKDDGSRTVVGELRDDDPNRTHIMLGSWFYPLSIALVSMTLGDTGYEGPYKLNPMSLHEANVG